MSLVTLNGLMIRQNLLTSGLGIPVVPPISVLQDSAMGVIGHSIWYENQGFHSVSRWLTLMTATDVDQSLESGFSFNTVPGAVPHDLTQNMPGTVTLTSPITDLVVMIDNFNSPPRSLGAEQDPSVGPAVDAAASPVAHFQSLIERWEAEYNNGETFWLYEVWLDGAQRLNTDGSGTAQQFADWRLHTTTEFGYTVWWDTIISTLKANIPSAADRIKSLPVSRTMVSAMENTALSSIPAGNWFFDDSPHGNDICYLLAAMVVYTVRWQAQAPLPDFTGASIDEVFSTNYPAIAAYIATEILG